MRDYLTFIVFQIFLVIHSSSLLWTGDSANDKNGLGYKNPSEKSPYYQHLPDCTKNGFKRVTKKTKAKGIVCPMFRDEEGFLSEWVAYYQMHGFDHVMLFDDGSVDNSLAEVQPWIKTGFVSVRSNWTADSLRLSHLHRKNEFKAAMATKALLERECKLQAIEWGYDIHVSLDVDEYVIPKDPELTVMDELVNFFNKTGRSVYCIEKLNFQSTPHLLEPVNLLTIEAYQTRMRDVARMSYYTTVASKCAYVLNGPKFSNISAQFIATCCHFHGCQGHDFIDKDRFCKDNFNSEAYKLMGKGMPWYQIAVANHYSRSLEKYALKQKTWKTATGESKAGEDSAQAAKSYDIPKFLSRNLGWMHDNTALRYSCQLREVLQNMTRNGTTVEPYMRPGTFWYRNAEFGRLVSDPDKRGRYGRPNPPGYKFSDGNPYHYFGEKQEGRLS